MASPSDAEITEELRELLNVDDVWKTGPGSTPRENTPTQEGYLRKTALFRLWKHVCVAQSMTKTDELVEKLKTFLDEDERHWWDVLIIEKYGKDILELQKRHLKRYRLKRFFLQIALSWQIKLDDISHEVYEESSETIRELRRLMKDHKEQEEQAQSAERPREEEENAKGKGKEESKDKVKKRTKEKNKMSEVELAQLQLSKQALWALWKMLTPIATRSTDEIPSVSDKQEVYEDFMQGQDPKAREKIEKVQLKSLTETKPVSPEDEDYGRWTYVFINAAWCLGISKEEIEDTIYHGESIASLDKRWAKFEREKQEKDARTKTKKKKKAEN